MTFDQIKKWVIFTTFTLFPFATSHAQDALTQIVINTNQTASNVASSTSTLGNYLANIQAYTQGTMNTLNTEITGFHDEFASLYTQLMAMIASWMSPDDSEVTKTITGEFSTFAQDLMNQSVSNPNNPPNTPNQQQTNLSTIYNQLLGAQGYNQTYRNWANDLTYGTLLNYPFFQKDPRNNKSINPQWNYIFNASAVNHYHIIPGVNPSNPNQAQGWNGYPQDVNRYTQYYNTVMAVESFNAYVLSNILSQSQTGGSSLTQDQQTLINYATSSDFFAQIAGKETLGQVFRQLLLFESQIYVLLTQFLQSQQQLVTAQVMTNALLIATNRDKENLMQAYAYSKNAQPIP